MEGINDRVKRWDVYDIADELADVPGMLDSDTWATWEIKLVLQGLEHRLWEASERGGNVGPSPFYDSEPGDDSGINPPFRGLVYAAGFSVVLWLALVILILMVAV